MRGEGGTPELERGRALVADDDRDTRDVVAATLEAAGVEVDVAADWNEALRLFERAAPDIVVLVLRRSTLSPPPDRDGDQVLRFGDELTIDATRREVILGGLIIIDTTAREFDLLFFLASSPGRVFTRHELLRDVWRSSADWQQDSTVTEHIRRLRKKIEVDPNRPHWLETMRGVGYRFNAGAAGG